MNRVDLLALAASAALFCAELGVVWARPAVELPAQAAAVRPDPPPAAPIADACPRLEVSIPESELSIGDDAEVPEVEDPAGKMTRFYEKVAALLRGRGEHPIRIALYGDSQATQDFMTGAMRRRLQTTWGDAGHGYVALVRPWNYKHQDVRYGDDGTWEDFNVTTKTTFDERYGHAFIAARSRTTASRTWVKTAEEGAPVGTRVSSFDVAFVRGPWFGKMEAWVDGELRETVDTHADEFGAGFARIEVPDGPHALELRGVGPGTLQLLGVSMERDVSGFVVDALGVGSMNCICMLRGDEGIHQATLRRRDYDLVLVHLGTNLFAADKAGSCMMQAIQRFSRGLGDAPLLVMSPSDRDEGPLPPRTVPYLKRTMAALHEASRATGAPFFDFWAAMGGEGSMTRFAKNGMAMPGDDVHFNAKGGAYMADRVIAGLWKGLRRYVLTHPRAGCGP